MGGPYSNCALVPYNASLNCALVPNFANLSLASSGQIGQEDHLGFIIGKRVVRPVLNTWTHVGRNLGRVVTYLPKQLFAACGWAYQKGIGLAFGVNQVVAPRLSQLPTASAPSDIKERTVENNGRHFREIHCLTKCSLTHVNDVDFVIADQGITISNSNISAAVVAKGPTQVEHSEMDMLRSSSDQLNIKDARVCSVESTSEHPIIEDHSDIRLLTVRISPDKDTFLHRWFGYKPVVEMRDSSIRTIQFMNGNGVVHVRGRMMNEPHMVRGGSIQVECDTLPTS